jgi:flagellar motor switch protein FliN/FliY
MIKGQGEVSDLVNTDQLETLETGSTAGEEGRPIELLYNVDMGVTVELGRTHMTMRELLALRPGKVIELDRLARSPVDILVNNTLLARGEVVVLDDELGVRITEITANASMASRPTSL